MSAANSHRAKKRTPKQRVLKMHPKAEWCPGCNCIHRDEYEGNLSEPRNEAEAWADAARRLK